jgi:hypothetical protein
MVRIGIPEGGMLVIWEGIEAISKSFVGKGGKNLEWGLDVSQVNSLRLQTSSPCLQIVPD